MQTSRLFALLSAVTAVVIMAVVATMTKTSRHCLWARLERKTEGDESRFSCFVSRRSTECSSSPPRRSARCTPPSGRTENGSSEIQHFTPGLLGVWITPPFKSWKSFKDRTDTTNLQLVGVRIPAASDKTGFWLSDIRFREAQFVRHQIRKIPCVRALNGDVP